MLPRQIIPPSPMDTTSREDLYNMQKQDRIRIAFAVYYDPLYDGDYADPTDPEFPLHLVGKTGDWYLPPPDVSLTFGYSLSEDEKRLIALTKLGRYFNAINDMYIRYLDNRVLKQERKKLQPNPLQTRFSGIKRAGPRLFQRQQRREEDDSCPDSSSSDEDDAEPLSEEEEEKARERRSRLVRIERFLRDVAKLDYSKLEDQITARAFKSKNLNTVYNYCSGISAVAKAGFPLTLEGYNKYLISEYNTKSGPTSQQYEISFTHWRNSSGQCGEDIQSRYLTKAIALEKGRTLTVRGSLTEDYVLDLISQPAVKKQSAIRDVYIMLAATGARCNQLVGLRSDACRVDPDQPQVWRVTVKRNFKGRSYDYARAYEIHFTNPNYHGEILRIVTEAKARSTEEDPHPVLLPDWKTGRGADARKLLAEQAKKLKWSEKLSWVLHSFRYGTACDAFLRKASAGEAAALAEVKKSTGHISITMLRSYAIPVRERESYRDMLLGESLLRATGVVTNALEGTYAPAPVPSLLRTSTMKAVGNSADLNEITSKLPQQHVSSRTGEEPEKKTKPRKKSDVAVAAGGRGGGLSKRGGRKKA